MPTLAINKYATSDYEILDKLEAGIKLLGGEVKSAKKGHVVLKGSYISLRYDEPWLIHSRIASYAPAAAYNSYDPDRDRKLLLTKKEIDFLRGRIKNSNLTIIPLKMYTKGGFIKVEIGLARGRKKYDKREILKKRDADRNIRRTLKYQ